jgi:hypothetical protein
MTAFLLLHPPLLGPAVWAPCAEVLRAAGHQVAVPDLRPAVEPPTHWYDRATTLAASAARSAPDGALVVAAHSGAGLLLPLVVDRVGAGTAVFVDALMPGRPTSDRFADFLAGLPVTDGRLPRWSEWWGPQELAELIPDADLLARIEADQPRLPVAFYAEQVPVPSSWPPPRVGYLQLSPAYEADAAEAREHGWPVRTRPGMHLDLATSPAEVAAEILILAT